VAAWTGLLLVVGLLATLTLRLDLSWLAGLPVLITVASVAATIFILTRLLRGQQGQPFRGSGPRARRRDLLRAVLPRRRPRPAQPRDDGRGRILDFESEVRRRRVLADQREEQS
jgi:hypothetical protein